MSIDIIPWKFGNNSKKTDERKIIDMQAIIMAGGIGNRLRPLTCAIPKPMVPIMGKPVMEYVIRLLRKHGITDATATLQYLPEEITKYFEDGSQYGMNIKYTMEEKPLGTAGGVAYAAKGIDSTFIVISGDGLTDLDITKALEFHRQNNSMATLVLKQMDSPLEFGVVMLNEDNTVKRFVEKPTKAQVFSDTVNTGIYILEPKVLDYIEQDKMVDFSMDVFPQLLNHGEKVYGYVCDDYWCDIGSSHAYLQAHRDVMDGKCRVDGPFNEINDKIYIGSDAIVHPNAEIESPCFIGAGCKIEEGARVGAYSVIGYGTTICNKADVERSVVWENSRIAESAQVRGCVLCESSVVLMGATVSEGAVVGDESIIGKNAVVKAHVSVWPDKRVGDDEILRTDLIWQPQSPAGSITEGGMQGVWGVDIYPESILMMVRSIKKTYGDLGSVLVSHEGGRYAAIASDTVALGMRALGVNVIQAGVAPSILVREAIIDGNAEWGIVVRAVGNEILFRIINEDGVCLGRKEFRKISQNARNTISEPAGKPGTLELIKLSLERCVQRLNSISAKGTRVTRFAVGGNGANADLLSDILLNMGNDVVRVDDLTEVEEWVKAKEILEEKMDVQAGFYLDDLDNSLVMILKEGKVNEIQMLDTAIYAMASSIKINRIPLYLECSQSIENWLSSKNINSTRVGRDESDVWQIIKDNYNAKSIMMVLSEPVGVAMMCAKMYMLDANWMNAAALTQGDVCTVTKTFDCKHEHLGGLIKELALAIDDGKSTLLEGVRVEHENGFALVQPDGMHARCRIVCRACNEEFANELAVEYENKVKRIMSNQHQDVE